MDRCWRKWRWGGTMPPSRSSSMPRCPARIAPRSTRKRCPALREKYIDTGKVRLVFREFPLERTAFWASIIARCAGEKRISRSSTCSSRTTGLVFGGRPVRGPGPSRPSRRLERQGCRGVQRGQGAGRPTFSRPPRRRAGSRDRLDPQLRHRRENLSRRSDARANRADHRPAASIRRERANVPCTSTVCGCRASSPSWTPSN